MAQVRTVVITDEENIEVIEVGIQGPAGPGASFNDAEGDPASTGTSGAADGTSNFPARRDHKHAINTVELDARYQLLDSDLTAIAALSPTNDDIIQRKSGAWVNRTPAQLKTDLSLTKSDVGLGNVDNTSDASKPISTATQAALDLKAPLASPALTGTPTAPTASAGTNTTQLATTAFVSTAVANLL